MPTMRTFLALLAATLCATTVGATAATLTACGSSDSDNAGGDAGPSAVSDAAATSRDASADAAHAEAAAPGIGIDGGTASTLYFAIVGDTRPPTENDLAGYPTSIITKIYQDVEALDPRPPFVVSTGDYQFSSTGSSSTASQQVDLYMQARAIYTGTWFPAMGNHECTGGDTSNCPAGSSSPTANYQAFMSSMLAPIKKTLPYYVINVNATDGSWTSKFVFTAPNAWDTTQQSWLSTVLAQKTTYTFVIRHEPSTSNPVPAGVPAIDSILANYPYTLLIAGHSHEYGHYSDAPKVAVIGNGGAPLSSSSKDYGYGVCAQRSDGALVCDEVDYMSGAKDPEYHFVITPAGTLTQ